MGGANDDTSFVEDLSNADTSVDCKPGSVTDGWSRQISKSLSI
jgi:hypothetical protein